jgi:carbamoyltransferase
MNVIGIHDGHNASVALLQDGKLVFALSEERLVRRKNAGGIPINAINRLLADTSLDSNSIDYVAVSGTAPPRPEWIERDKIMSRYREQFSKEPARLQGIFERVSHLFSSSKGSAARLTEISSAERLEKLAKMGFRPERIILLDHHRCHAAAAYYASRRQAGKVLVLTNDGGGDGLCATVNLGENGRITRLAEVKQENSFATLFGRTTFLMGMVPLEHEYKLMGMAPYGDEGRARTIADEILQYFEWPDDRPFGWRKKAALPPTYRWGPLLEDIFRFRRFDDISAAMQMVVEDMALKWIRRCLDLTGAHQVVLGGGLFMNVKLNKRIMELPEVEDVYIMPSCSDESNSIGAAYMGAVENGMAPEDVASLRDLYLGAVYTEEEIRNVTASYPFSAKVDIDEPEDMEDRVATLLAAGEVVARYAGREEFGARALGNRSILSDPSQLENIVKINKMIKQRDFWMPFAASMTVEQAAENLYNPKGHFSPYMVMTFDSVRERTALFRAATHPYDGTIRPQIVNADWNPGYHKIIRRFAEKTGRNCGVLNTSFNLHGFPIVSSPQDALEVFEKSGLNLMAIGPFILRKH